MLRSSFGYPLVSSRSSNAALGGDDEIFWIGVEGFGDLPLVHLRAQPSPVSLFVGPTGDVIGEPLVGAEGIAEAEIDVSKSIIPKQDHDIIGYYNRFDIFQLRMNKSPQLPLIVEETGVSNGLASALEQMTSGRGHSSPTFEGVGDPDAST